MKRLNFTLDLDTVKLLNELAETYYGGNKSQTVRAALESLATHTGHEGWVISGYTPTRVDENINCHTCGESHNRGDILYRPVFERGSSSVALPKIPNEPWYDCPDCAESHFASS